MQFLHMNIKTINKNLSLKVIIVYDDLIPMLGNTIKKLPVLIIGGKSIEGNGAIYKQLTMSHGKSNDTANTLKDTGNCELEKFWNLEMHSGVDNETDETDELMDTVKQRALDQSQRHREDGKKKAKKKDFDIPNTQDSVPFQTSDKISDMAGGDPMMQKFWENQESTPGFE
jgi:hypothetical protein